LIAIVVAAAIDIVETAFFVRWSKRRRTAVGLETLVGRHAVVVRPLSPRGQVKLDGEVWEARAQYDLLPGDEVVVRAVDGLVLEVEPRS
jgi:membrane-bound serine protease (ClpP class)